MRLLTSLLLALLLVPCVALADGTDVATEMIYEAADAIDAARAEQQAGRTEEADRLLREAEVRLTEARKLAPDLARIGYELARIHLLRGDAAAANLTLEGALRLDLPIEDHVRMAGLFDEIRVKLGKPTAGAAWKQGQQIRNGGLAVLAGGLAALGVGLAVAYTSFDQAATDGVTEENLQLNRFGWAFAGIGGGIAAGGGALTIVGQMRVESLRAVLPGPWRLADTTLQFGLRVRF